MIKKEPQPRERIFDLYWYFAYERQAVFERRVAGSSSPWSNDPILREYKFCNVFRAADRVSQYMIRSVACEDLPGNLDDQLFRIIAFRMFSNIKTWETLKVSLGSQPNIAHLESGAFQRALGEVLQQNGKLYTGAFILCANNAFGFSQKYKNHTALFKSMFLTGKLGARLRNAGSLKRIYEILHEFPLLGDFMSYQIAIDLNYSSQFTFGENDFCQVGPGAVRGIKKAFTDLGDFSPSEVVTWMVLRQDQEFARLGFKFKGLWGRPLHAIDCQGLFCELDKYCRVAAPEIRSARQRIKMKYSPSTSPIALFFPPKWKINNALPKRSVLGIP